VLNVANKASQKVIAVVVALWQVKGCGKTCDNLRTLATNKSTRSSRSTYSLKWRWYCI